MLRRSESPRRIPTGARTSKLAILGAVLAMCMGPVGLLLSIVALVRIRRNPMELKGRDLAIGGIVFSFGWLIWAAIALPGFAKFQARARQGECRQLLADLREPLRATAGARLDVAALGVAPSKRSALFLSSADAPVFSGPGQDAIAPSDPDAPTTELVEAVRRADLRPGHSAQGWTVACAANVDGDETIDLWVLDGATGRIEQRADDVAD
jgi:hypothetical protein